MAPGRASSGFTLLEMLVALAIFSIAAMAMLNLAGQNARTAAALEQRAFALVVAENLAVEAAMTPTPPPDGVSRGEERLASQVWRWERRVSATSDPNLARIEIDVAAADVDQVAASIVTFRAK